MKARVSRIESGSNFVDGNVRVTFTVEGAEGYIERSLTFSAKTLTENGIRNSYLDQRFELTLKEILS